MNTFRSVFSRRSVDGNTFPMKRIYGSLCVCLHAWWCSVPSCYDGYSCSQAWRHNSRRKSVQWNTITVEVSCLGAELPSDKRIRVTILIT